jgi:uncharacterized protein
MTNQNALVNGDSATFWAAAEAGRLELQRCPSCGNIQFPPRHQCASCWNMELEPIQSGGRGTIESVTIVRRAPLPEFRALVPYVIAAVRVAEGPRMMTNIVGERALQAAIGDAVLITFQRDNAGRMLPQFRLADTPAGIPA